MGSAQEVRLLHQNVVRSEGLAYGTLPTAADGVAAAAITLTANGVAWTFGAWAEIVSAAGNTANRQIWGITLENFVGAPSQGEVEIGTGAGGAEAAFCRLPAVAGFYPLPKPRRVATGTRIAARYRVSNAAADTVDVKLCSLTGHEG